MPEIIEHHTTPKYWQLYSALPSEIQNLADKNFKLLKENPRHPSLHFKQVNQYWSVRVGINHRAIGVQDPETKNNIIWFWIGPHDEYDTLLKKK